MTRICDVTGKRVLFGNNVSHSNRKSRRKFLPNLHKLKFWVSEKKCFIKMNVSSKGLKFINKYGINAAMSFIDRKKIYGKKNKNN